jgi:hypothetical protein
MGVSSRGAAIVGPFAFYRVVPLHSPYMWMALVGVTAIAMLVLLVDPSAGEEVVIPIVLLQMFAASTGFVVPARRGHYDLLMTAGAGRLQIAATHFAVSVAPGLAAWLAVACVEFMLRGGDSRAFAAGSIAALLLVSSLAWAVTVPLPRLSGGIVWLLAIVMLLGTTDDWRNAAMNAGEGIPSVGAAVVYALCPFLLVGRPLDLLWPAAWLLGPAAVLSALAVAAALAWMARMDMPLEASQ